MKKVLSVFAAISMSAAAAQADVTCTATCHNTCVETLFTESPDPFSNQKCKDYGGQGGIVSGGKYECLKYTYSDFEVSGYGELTHQAQKDAYDECRAPRPECDNMDSSWIKGGYACS
jgi:hypothetical protein